MVVICFCIIQNPDKHTLTHLPKDKIAAILQTTFLNAFLYPRPTKLEGGYTGFTLSVCPSVRPSVCRRHGFRSISQVCFGISISNFICLLKVAIGRSLLIFSDVTFKMAAWRPYWIFWFPDSNFYFGFEYQLQTSAAQYLCIWVGAYWFSATSISKWPPGGHIRFFGFWTL